jgi:hypothetical protein
MRDVNQAVQSFEQLAEEDPYNLEVRRDVANSYKARADFLAETGHLQEALAMSRKALAAYEELGQADPASAENAAFLAQVRVRIAVLEGGR